jgi:hypothetical protein
MSAEVRSRLAMDIAGLGAVLNMKGCIAASDAFEAHERQEAMMKLFLAGQQLTQKLAELQPLAPRSADAGYGRAADLKEISR